VRTRNKRILLFGVLFLVAVLTLFAIAFSPSGRTGVRTVERNDGDVRFELVVTAEFDPTIGWDWERPRIQVYRNGRWHRLDMKYPRIRVEKIGTNTYLWTFQQIRQSHPWRAKFIAKKVVSIPILGRQFKIRLRRAVWWSETVEPLNPSAFPPPSQILRGETR
jgi:hypothetical protein